jgi:hypothetical protein
MHSELGEEDISNVITKPTRKVNDSNCPYLALAEAFESRYHQTWDAEDIEQTVELYNKVVDSKTRQEGRDTGTSTCVLRQPGTLAQVIPAVFSGDVPSAPDVDLAGARQPLSRAPRAGAPHWDNASGTRPCPPL